MVFALPPKSISSLCRIQFEDFRVYESGGVVVQGILLRIHVGNLLRVVDVLLRMFHHLHDAGEDTTLITTRLVFTVCLDRLIDDLSNSKLLKVSECVVLSGERLLSEHDQVSVDAGCGAAAI